MQDTLTKSNEKQAVIPLLMVSAGRTPAPVRLGKRTLWRIQDLEAWVASGCPPRWRAEP